MPEVVVSHFYPCSTDALKAEGKRQKKKAVQWVPDDLTQTG